MAEEFEVKIIEIDIPRLRPRLAELGTLARRVHQQDRLYGNDHTRDAGVLVRLRQESDGPCWLTAKSPYRETAQGKSREEIEIAVPDLQTGQSLLRLMGLVETASSSQRREYYQVDGVSVEIIDTPAYPPYLELEGDRPQVLAVCGKLGIDEARIYIGPRAAYGGGD